jgi:hypothetical protein
VKDKAAMAFLANFIPAYIRYAPGRLKTAVFAGKNLSGDTRFKSNGDNNEQHQQSLH